MSWFQLDPQSLAGRAATRPAPSLAQSVMHGAIGFTLVSVAGFVPWAVTGKWLYRHVGEVGMYAACLVVFLGLAGLFLHRLIIGAGSLGRFYRLFSLAFLAYSIAWMTAWMTLRGHPGSLVGLLAGTAIMGWILTRAFDASAQTFTVTATLFALNAIGYFAGGFVEARFSGTPGKLGWGVCYGLGFGAGLGFAFYLCQAEARRLLGKG